MMENVRNTPTKNNNHFCMIFLSIHKDGKHFPHKRKRIYNQDKVLSADF